MSVELDRDVIQWSVKAAIRKHLAIWRGEHYDVPDRLATLMTEVMFDVASTTDAKSPEAGIRAGLQMIRNWKDR